MAYPPPGAEGRNLPGASTSGRSTAPPAAASLATVGRRMQACGRSTVRPRTALPAIHEPGTTGSAPDLEVGGQAGGDQPASSFSTEPPASIAFLMRAVLDADTIPDTTKRRLLAMGAARGLDFDRLVGVSMWDEASGVVSRADGQWPSVEGFEAGTSLTPYTPSLDDWRAGALPPALATGLDAVAAEVVEIVEAVRIEVQPSDGNPQVGLEDGEAGGEGDDAQAVLPAAEAATGDDPDELAIAALEERVRKAAAASSASAAAPGSPPAKKGFGGFGGGGGAKAKAGRKGAAGKRSSASSASYPPPAYSYSTVGQSLTPDAFIIAGPDLEDTVDALMAPVEGVGGLAPSSSPFRSSCDDKAARSLAAAAAALLGVLTDADMEGHLEDPYGGGNFREEEEKGGKVVDVEVGAAADSPVASASSATTTPLPSRECLEPGVAKGFAAAIRAAHKAKAQRDEEEERERERAAAEAAAAAAAPVLPPTPDDGDALRCTSAAEAAGEK